MKVEARRADGKRMVIDIDDEVVEILKKQPCEYRVSTDCYGTVIVPIELKPPKNDDYVVDLGGKLLFISSTQATWLRKITLEMFRASCLI
ncbi:MAG: hypothetical protein N3F04_02830 [Candidatus Nezhaarchaeota archaeon]|nr:hypothetical protein [Candidatus Nezhaarchaeota archaeon]MCX8141705.1 hypothetical protein [Candidatus Nezhaarchaeota archaeon]MDW8049972.1 hypothetical protein [Nitrososphaerota archaeon]